MRLMLLTRSAGLLKDKSRCKMCSDDRCVMCDSGSGRYWAFLIDRTEFGKGQKALEELRGIEGAGEV